MTTIPFEFDIDTSNAAAALGLRVLLDDRVIYDTQHVKAADHVTLDISDEDGQHTAIFELYGKLPEHTKITDSGQIESDSLITVTNIQFDGIDVTELVHNLSRYHHDFNGTQPPAENRFYGSLGCNGQVHLKFETPIYLWLLENM